MKIAISIQLKDEYEIILITYERRDEGLLSGHLRKVMGQAVLSREEKDEMPI
ncbi:MAG: hypothetical protein J7L53_01875 [Deltaproteobacteria bacterium]|nr:hypothetical protein [Deltaproteobacteria bacterium]